MLWPVDCGMELTRFPPALFVSRFRPVGPLVTHGKGGIPSLYQDGIKGTRQKRHHDSKMYE
jgi:hypothetical protein